MRPISRVGDTNDLAPYQMLKIDIGVCLDKRQRADIKFVCDAVKRITRPDSIPTRITLTTVDRYVDICPRLQAFRIDLWVYLQDAFNADIEFSGYSAYGITPFD